MTVMAAVIVRGIFTVAVIALTVFGVQWNKSALKNIRSGGDGQLLANVSLSADSTLPAKVNLISSEINLGEWQEAQVTTSPHAKVTLSVVAGESKESKQIEQTTADQSGNATIRFKINDWHSLGSVRVIVVAHSGSAIGQVTSSFQLLGEPDYPIVDEPAYSYPLLP